MRTKLNEIRRLLKGHEPARGRRYPARVRDAVTGYALERRDAGASWSTIEGELGMRYETVRRWCHATTREAGIVPVEVVLEDVPPRSEVAIVSPSGYRLEGLEPGEAVAALKALG